MLHSPDRTRRRRALAGLIAVGSIAAVASNVHAADDANIPVDQRRAADDVPVDQLTTGYWKGDGWASGTGVGTITGMDTTVTGQIIADFEFAAIEEPGAAGRVTGTWSHFGLADLDFSGSIQGQEVNGAGALSFNGADGTMNGDTRLIQLNGSMATTGVLSAEVGGIGTSTPVDNVTQMPTLEVRVLGGTCDSVSGEWAYSIESEIADQGLNATFDGQWTAWRDPAMNIDGGVEALAEAFEAAEAGEEADLAFSGSPLFDAAMDAVAEFNEYTERYPNWDIDEVLMKVRDAEWLLEDLRATSDCERIFLGDDRVEQFDTLLTGVVQSLIDFGLQLDDVSPGSWQLLANLGVRTGAVGAGAANPELAAAAESSLRTFAEAELNRRAGDDGSLSPTEEVQALVGTSAMMGWDLTIGGNTTPAVELWAELVDQL